jgi:hypothetical protein
MTAGGALCNHRITTGEWSFCNHTLIAPILGGRASAVNDLSPAVILRPPKDLAVELLFKSAFIANKNDPN